jgi:hypothetical protein
MFESTGREASRLRRKMERAIQKASAKLGGLEVVEAWITKPEEKLFGSVFLFNGLSFGEFEVFSQMLGEEGLKVSWLGVYQDSLEIDV